MEELEQNQAIGLPMTIEAFSTDTDNKNREERLANVSVVSHTGVGCAHCRLDGIRTP